MEELLSRPDGIKIAVKMWLDIMCLVCGKKACYHAGGVHGKHYDAVQKRWQEMLSLDGLSLAILKVKWEDERGQE